MFIALICKFVNILLTTSSLNVCLDYVCFVVGDQGIGQHARKCPKEKKKKRERERERNSRRQAQMDLISWFLVSLYIRPLAAPATRHLYL